MNTQTRIVTESTPCPQSLCHHIRRISWTAILAGAFVGIGASFLLNLLCVGIGLSAFSATKEGATVLAVGGFIGLVISAFVSMFLAGWVAGSIARPFSLGRHAGELYGFITWSVTLVLMVLLSAHIGKFVSDFSDTVIVVHPNAQVVNVTTNNAAPLVSQKTVTNPATGNTTTQATVNAEKATNAMGATAFATFFLFFIGAIASTFGGGVAIHCRRKDADADNCSICHK